MRSLGCLEPNVSRAAPTRGSIDRTLLQLTNHRHSNGVVVEHQIQTVNGGEMTMGGITVKQHTVDVANSIVACVVIEKRIYGDEPDHAHGITVIVERAAKKDATIVDFKIQHFVTGRKTGDSSTCRI